MQERQTEGKKKTKGKGNGEWGSEIIYTGGLGKGAAGCFPIKGLFEILPSI